MKPVSRADLERLMAHREPMSLSLFMSTHPPGPQTQEDQIRLKNLLRTAEQQLVAEGMRPADARRRTASIPAAAEANLFWQRHGRGLVLFIDSGDPVIFRVPFDLAESVCVDDRFYLKPLLPLLGQDNRFFIFALSLNSARLFEATSEELTAVPLEGAPQNFAEVTRFDVRDENASFHSAMPIRGGVAPTGMFHGQGGGADEAIEKRRMLEYCRMVEAALAKRLKGETAPLVLMAAEPLIGLYRGVNRYPHLAATVVHGSPDRTAPADLLRQARPIVEPMLAGRLQKGLDAYWNRINTALAMVQLEAIVPAAYRGQVETLFVSATEHKWGRFDPETLQVEMHETRQPGDHDLLDLAAVTTYLRGGDVFVLPHNRVPSGARAAATLRFARTDVAEAPAVR